MKYITIKNEMLIKSVDTFETSNSIDTKKIMNTRLSKLEKEIKAMGYLLPNIDCISNSVEPFKKIIELYDYCKNECIPFGIKENGKTVLAYIKSDVSNENLNKIEALFKVLLIDDKSNRYSYIYDTACDEFDTIFAKNNYCNFRNDSCSCQRNAYVIHEKMGCCYEFHYREFDNMPIYTGECSHLTPTGCDTKCLGCKMFTCKYLRTLGVRFKSDDNFLLKIFLNQKQKSYTDNTYFKTKEEILKEWERLSK